AASIRNAAAVAGWLSRQEGPISVIAAGERWEDGTWRFAVEDLVAAGAVIAHLEGHRSPEAASAVAAFNAARDELLAVLQGCSSGRELMNRGFPNLCRRPCRLPTYAAGRAGFNATAARMRAFRAFSFSLSPSWKSMARLVLPSRLELKRPAGSLRKAPLAKVIFTTFLYVSPV